MFRIAAIQFSLVFLVLAAVALADVPLTINYQGRLGDPMSDPVDTTVAMTFRIYNDTSTGTPIWSETHPTIVVETGLFTVLLGSMTTLPVNLFDGVPCSLSLQIDSGPESAPMLPLVSTLYAYRSGRADTADFALAGSGDGSGWIDNGTVVSLVVPGDSVGIGTDNPSATLDVEGTLLVREKATVGRNNLNLAEAAFVTGDSNEVRCKYGAIVGGKRNDLRGASDDPVYNPGYSAILGGFANTLRGNNSTIAGGAHNLINGCGICDMSWGYAFIGGGYANAALHSFATVGGGSFDTATTKHSIVSGGYHNQAGWPYSTVAMNPDTGWAATVGGGSYNRARAAYSVIAGGGGPDPGDSNSVHGRWSAVLGGRGNTIKGEFATIGGGDHHYIGGDYSAIPGGLGDTLEASHSVLIGLGSYLGRDSTFMVDMPYIQFGDGATGYDFPASRGSEGDLLVLDSTGDLNWMDLPATEWTLADSVLFTTEQRGLAKGMADNVLYGPYTKTHINLGEACTTGWFGYDMSHIVVAGGRGNKASVDYSSVMGGQENVAAANHAAVLGGYDNSASGASSVACGGYSNNVTGGYSAILGGWDNWAHASYSVVLGGYENIARERFSIAAGRRARADHVGSFVWSDSTDTNFSSSAPNQFLIRAGGGMGIGTESPAAQLHVNGAIRLGAGSREMEIFEVDGDTAAAWSEHIAYDGIAIGSNSGNNRQMFMFTDGADNDNIFTVATSQNNGGTWHADVVVQQSGVVGIATGTPDASYKLDVNGNIRCVDLTETSDARFKCQVTPLTRALQVVEQLEPVRYLWARDAYPDKNFPDGQQIGLLAQQVQQIAPEVVSVDGSGYYAINYSKLTPILIEALKEMQIQNQDRGEQVDKLSAEVKQLRELVLALTER